MYVYLEMFKRGEEAFRRQLTMISYGPMTFTLGLCIV